MTNDTPARCGTTTGYTYHQNHGETPCDACAGAKRDYDKRWRSAPDRTRKNRLAAKAQGAAYRRLAHEFPDLYRTYYAEAKAEAEVTA